VLIGHLAPVGPIAAIVERHWRSEWPRWTRALPWAAALMGCVFPDLDVIANVLLTGTFLHLYYLPHSLFPYLPVLGLGWLLVRRQQTRLAGLATLAFGMGVLSHLLLDAISHGTVLLYPLWNGLVGWTFPHTDKHVLRSYFHSPNFWLEPMVCVAALAWWLARGVRVRAVAWRKERVS
jgi:hypothetical protein